MFVAVKGQRKGFDLFPACMEVGNIIFDQLGIGDFVHGTLSGIQALWMHKGNSATNIKSLIKVS